MRARRANEQGKILYRYISKWNFISTHLHLQTTASSITYESDAHSTLSTLDHILCPSFMLPKFISAYVIMEPLNISDHYPVFAALHCDYPSFTPPPSTNASSVTPRNWASTPREVIRHLYTIPLQQPLDSLMHNIPSSSHLLNPSLIDDLFHSLTSILVSISTHIPSKSFQPHRSPGWNYTLKCASRRCKLRFHE